MIEKNYQDFEQEPSWLSAQQSDNARIAGTCNITAHLFNSAIGAAAISAVYELGLLDVLKQNEPLNLTAFCKQNDLHKPTVLALLQTLHYFKIIKTDSTGDVVLAGPEFEETYKNKGYFLWLIRGYGDMLKNLATIAKNENRSGNFSGRDGKYIALSGRDYGAQFVDQYFTNMLAQMPFKAAADIGCGSGERLINLANCDPEFKGVGIELNMDAAALAKQSVSTAKLQDRITIIQSDVKTLTGQPELSEIEVLFSFFMAHDLWPRENCLSALKNILSVFPRIERFLLCDTYRSDLPDAHEIPVFTLGFEVTHAVMGQYIPSLSEWTELFAEAGWHCANKQFIDLPFSCIFDLRPAHKIK